MPMVVCVVPVSVLLALAVIVVAVAWRRVVRSTVVGAGVIVAAAQQQAGGGQHDESLGGTRNSQSHHFLPVAQSFSLAGAPAEAARRPSLQKRYDMPRRAIPAAVPRCRVDAEIGRAHV